MATQIFVNLPVKDLNRSVKFFTQLGYSFNPQFTNEDGTCMIISENIYVMLLVEKFFRTFIPNEIADGNIQTEALICLSAESKEEVDSLVNKALEAGGTAYRKPKDHGFMYERCFRDPDGHSWEIMHMDLAAFTKAQDATKAVGVN